MIDACETQLKDIIEAMPDAMLIVGRSGHILLLNSHLQALFGYLAGDLLGQPVSTLIPDWSVQAGSDVELSAKRKDGSWFPARIRSGQYKIGEDMLFLCTVSNLTRYVQLEETLRQVENRFAAIFQHSPACITLFRLCDETIVDVNGSCLELCGYAREEMVGRTAHELGMWSSASEWERMLVQLEAQGRITDFETVICQKSGGRCFVLVAAEKVVINGELILVVQAIDLSQHKQVEMALKASEEKYRGLMESLDTVVVTIDADGRFLYLNDVAARRLGGQASAFIGKTMVELFPDSSVVDWQLENIQRVIRDDSKLTVENQTLVQGQMRWSRTIIQPIHGENGQVVSALVNSSDIDDLKTAHAKLEELNHTLEERVRQRSAEAQDLYDNAPCGYHSLNPEGCFIMVNQTELDWLGYSRDEMLGHCFENFVTERSLGAVREKFLQIKQFGAVKDFECELVRKDGRILLALLNATALYDDAGNFSMCRATVFDNTERNKAEDALRESEEQNRLLFEVFPDAITLLDKNGHIIRVNHAYEVLAGLPREEMLGRTAEELGFVSYETREHLQAIMVQSREDQEPFGVAEYVFVGVGGVKHNVESRMFLLKIEGTTHALIATRDISQHKKAEEALRHANFEMERAMRMKDEFLASMSHELRTPLTGILGLSEAMQLNTYGDLTDKQRNALINIESSGRHLLDLINDILDISKIEAGKLELQMEPCSLGEICQSSLQLIKGMAEKKYQNISFTMNPAIITVRGDARRLKQVLVNLLSNASKYSPENGSLGLEVSADDVTQIVSITVWDRGIGIQPDDLSKLFKPFVQLNSSLTRQQAGTGLGLALVQRLVDMHGGSIHVKSTPGQGSRFTIDLTFLPFGATQPRARNGWTREARRIMVLEPNNTDTELISRYLKMLGIEFVIYPTAADIVARALSTHPDVILVNSQIQGVPAADVLAQLKTNEKTKIIPAIITSSDLDEEQAIQLGAAGSLSKHFTLADLRMALLRIQANRASPSGPVKPASPENSTGAHLANIAIVDDNEINVIVVGDFLRAKHYRIFSSLNGQDFLLGLASARPDIVLMDIQMPGMDGFETIRRLRAHTDPQLASVPVIAVTALAMPGDRERCLKAGANEYLSKPVRLPEILALIQSMLGKT